MGHQPGIAEKRQQIVDAVGKQRLVGEKTLGQPVDRDGGFGDIPLGIEIGVEFPPGRHQVEKLDTGYFDDTITAGGIEPGGFRIEHDFAHIAPMSRICRRFPVLEYNREDASMYSVYQVRSPLYMAFDGV